MIQFSFSYVSVGKCWFILLNWFVLNNPHVVLESLILNALSLSFSNVALDIVIYSSELVWFIKCSVRKFGSF